MAVTIAYLSILFVTSLIISFQDFKSRLVSLWVLIGYAALIIGFTILSEGINTFLQNLIMASCYFLLCLLGVFTYYFLKERQIPRIMDVKLGWADVIVCLSIGISLNLISLILFFTVSFILSAIAGIVLQQKNKTVPLAGLLVIFYFVFICISIYFPLDLMGLIGY